MNNSGLPRTISLEQVYEASRPALGFSGTLPPIADANFKRLYLDISVGYDVPGVGAGGAAVLRKGDWRERGGGSPPYIPAAASPPGSDFVAQFATPSALQYWRTTGQS